MATALPSVTVEITPRAGGANEAPDAMKEVKKLTEKINAAILGDCDLRYRIANASYSGVAGVAAGVAV